MKTIQAKTTSNAHNYESKSNQPFFKKGGDESLMPKNDSFFSRIQPKISVGQPNDKYEQEADNMADKVVQRLATPDVSRKQESILQAKTISNFLPSVNQVNHPIQSKSIEHEEEKLQKKENTEKPQELQLKPIFESGGSDDDTPVQRKCATCGHEEEKKVQAKSETSSAETAPSSVESSLSSSKGGGSPLPENTRTQMESSFGTDFSGVRVHTGSNATQMSENLNAQAFTHGNDIYFNSGKYDTNSQSGQHLLAHELTHTVQQGGIRRKVVQKQPTTRQIPIIPKKPSNPITLNHSSNSFSANGDPANKKNPENYLPFDTSLEIWNPYLEENYKSLGAFNNNREVTQSNKGPNLSQSKTDFQNEISFTTGVDAKGTAGSIVEKTELKALYDFNTYKWIPVISELGTRLPDPPSYGRVAYPVEVTYKQIIDYSDAKGRKVKINIYGIVHFTPEQWENAIGIININKLSPPSLLTFKGEFGSYSWRMQGKGASQNYNFENISGSDSIGKSPNLQELAKIQQIQTLHGITLPFPKFTQPYSLAGDQFVDISNYLDAADKIEQDFQKKLATLPKLPEPSNSDKDDSDSFSWTMPTWLQGILIGIAIIAATAALIYVIAVLIVEAALVAGITLVLGTVVKIMMGIILVVSFLVALNTRINEASKSDNVSWFKILGTVILDTFGIGLLIEAITDKSLLTGKPLNQSEYERWKNGTIGLITSVMSFLGLRGLTKGKPTLPLLDKTPFIPESTEPVIEIPNSDTPTIEPPKKRPANEPIHEPKLSTTLSELRARLSPEAQKIFDQQSRLMSEINLERLLGKKDGAFDVSVAEQRLKAKGVISDEEFNKKIEERNQRIEANAEKAAEKINNICDETDGTNRPDAKVGDGTSEAAITDPVNGEIVTGKPVGSPDGHPGKVAQAIKNIKENIVEINKARSTVKDPATLAEMNKAVARGTERVNKMRPALDAWNNRASSNPDVWSSDGTSKVMPEFPKNPDSL